MDRNGVGMESEVGMEAPPNFTAIQHLILRRPLSKAKGLESLP
jgi:hypothetical protein